MSAKHVHEGRSRWGLAAAMVLGLALAGSPGTPAAAAEVELHGFVESAFGARTTDVGNPPAAWGNPPAELLPRVWRDASDFTLRETRLQLRGDMYGEAGEGHFALDYLADEIPGDGTGLELREGYLKFNGFSDHLEVRAGRQPTTWGTGDLLFINDLFPKDWVSFFVGRDDQYLKSPSDALRLGFYGLPFNVDLVYTPKFKPDLIPTGERLVFWTPALLPPQHPREELKNGELALRLNRYLGSINLAAYGYVGFWKSPQGLLLDGGGAPTAFFYPRLNVYGASARGGALGGVLWLEGGYYDSRDDLGGGKPNLPNSELRAMAGYERQWWSDFTGGMQVYWEHMMDHAKARRSLDEVFGPNAYLKDEDRLLLTLRLRQMMLYQTLTLSVFTFYSPTDKDTYTRLAASYQYTDEISLTVGGNVFYGKDNRTLLGMNDSNDNVFARLRYAF